MSAELMIGLVLLFVLLIGVGIAIQVYWWITLPPE